MMLLPDTIRIKYVSRNGHTFLFDANLDRDKHELYKGKSWAGVDECPVCKGKLYMSHAAYNGHVHGQCETKGCLSWME